MMREGIIINSSCLPYRRRPRTKDKARGIAFAESPAVAARRSPRLQRAVPAFLPAPSPVEALNLPQTWINSFPPSAQPDALSPPISGGSVQFGYRRIPRALRPATSVRMYYNKLSQPQQRLAVQCVQTPNAHTEALHGNTSPISSRKGR